VERSTSSTFRNALTNVNCLFDGTTIVTGRRSPLPSRSRARWRTCVLNGRRREHDPANLPGGVDIELTECDPWTSSWIINHVGRPDAVRLTTLWPPDLPDCHAVLVHQTPSTSTILRLSRRRRYESTTQSRDGSGRSNADGRLEALKATRSTASESSRHSSANLRYMIRFEYTMDSYQLS